MEPPWMLYNVLTDVFNGTVIVLGLSARTGAALYQFSCLQLNGRIDGTGMDTSHCSPTILFAHP